MAIRQRGARRLSGSYPARAPVRVTVRQAGQFQEHCTPIGTHIQLPLARSAARAMAPVYQVFGDDLDKLLEELNGALVA